MSKYRDAQGAGKTLDRIYDVEISNDTKVLRGPFFFQDENMTWYPRKAVIIYKRKIMFSPARSSESSKSSKPEEVKKLNQSK